MKPLNYEWKNTKKRAVTREAEKLSSKQKHKSKREWEKKAWEVLNGKESKY